MTVVVEVVDQVLLVRIEREHKRNAIDRDTAQALGAAFDRLDDDPALRVGVLTGTAGVFSAGTDLNEPVSPTTERGGEYGVVRRRREKPLIAAVEGLAFGGGFEMVLASDLVVAATTARFALPESRRGLVASSGGLFRALRALPRPVAIELLLTGAELDAAHAHELGLVNRVTDPGAAVEEALRTASEICASSPVSVRETLRALAALDEADDAAGWAATAAAQEVILPSQDRREGIAAFLERRPPRWDGR